MLNLVHGTVRLKHTSQAIVSRRDGTAQASTTIIKANKQATYAIPAAQFPTPNSRTPNQTIKKKGQEYPKTTENNITVDAITKRSLPKPIPKNRDFSASNKGKQPNSTCRPRVL